MARKVINIKSARIDKNKPLIAMTSKELDEVFMAGDGELVEPMLDHARGGGVAICIVATVLCLRDSQERIVCAHPEYGDQDNVDLCEKAIVELSNYLHAGERLRLATYVVDPTGMQHVKMPSEKALYANGDKGCRRYMQLHSARGLLTVVVTWLVTCNARFVFSYDIDHGDGEGMYTYAKPLVKSVRWNKLLARDERLEVGMYVVPVQALAEINPASYLMGAR